MPDAVASVGAMTHSFIKAVECEPRGITYGRLLSSMRAIMKGGGGGGGGSYGEMQGPYGAAPIHQQHQVANFSGVQVSLAPGFIHDDYCPDRIIINPFVSPAGDVCRSRTCRRRRCSTSTASPSSCKHCT
jgi:hypothetical protein